MEDLGDAEWNAASRRPDGLEIWVLSPSRRKMEGGDKARLGQEGPIFVALSDEENRRNLQLPLGATDLCRNCHLRKGIFLANANRKQRFMSQLPLGRPELCCTCYFEVPSHVGKADGAHRFILQLPLGDADLYCNDR